MRTRKRIHSLLITAVLSTGMAMPWVAWAQTSNGHDHNHGATPVAVQAPLTDGEVKKVDLDAGKVTIKHGEIRNLDMPPMTMVFTVKDKALLSGVKAGDKVRFMAVSEAGKILLTDIQPAP